MPSALLKQTLCPQLLSTSAILPSCLGHLGKRALWVSLVKPEKDGVGCCSLWLTRKAALSRSFEQYRLHKHPACWGVRASLSVMVPQVDPALMRTSLNTSLNLITVCGFIIWMQKHGHLPDSTALVLSQVSFNVVIPCFLMSKVSQTIALQKEWNIFSLPFLAFGLILVGLALGKLAGVILYRRFYLSSSMRKQACVKEALVTVSCAFGNCVTLPLVFLNGMLAPHEYSIACGYLALLMVGWSPCLWTIGYQILSAFNETDVDRSSQDSLSWIAKGLIQLINPPIYGVLVGLLLGGTPLSQFCFVKEGFVSTDTVFSFMRLFLQPVIEAAKLLGSASVAIQSIVLASTVASSLSHVGYKKEPTVSKHNQDAVRHLSLEAQAVWTITAIRLLIMPLVGFILVGVFRYTQWLPNDPLCVLTVLVVAAMPTAQNLVVMVQLNSSTRPFATVLSNLLMQQYLLSAVSLTFWMAIFSSYVHTLF